VDESRVSDPWAAWQNRTCCMEPQDPDVYVTTSFCIYPPGHGGTHSWQDDLDERHERLMRMFPSRSEEAT
jgi:hypothetical protein